MTERGIRVGVLLVSVLWGSCFAIDNAAHARDLYVAPGGNDASPGTAAQPLATIEAARDLLRRERSTRAGMSANTIWIRDGEYRVQGTLELTAADSGASDAPLVIRALGDDHPRITNARVVRAADFHLVTGPSTLARIAPAVRGKVVELDLSSIGVRHIPPFPDIFTDRGGLVDLFFDGKRMPLSRFPNDGFMTIKRVLDTGGGLQDKNWSSPSHARQNPPTTGGTFEYRAEFAEKFAAWQKALDRGVWLKGYWWIPWDNPASRVASIDTAAHTVTFAKPVPGGIGNKYHRPEGNGQEPFWAFNLLEEIDQPGEWCVDFKDQKLYFYPPGPLERAQVRLADQEAPVVLLKGASHVLLRGLAIEAGLRDGISIEGGEGNTIAGCTIRAIDHNGVVLDGGGQNAVQSCDLYDLGAGGVWLRGGDEASNPRVAAGHRVVNNHIHHFAQIERVYSAGINAGFTGGGGGGHHVAVGMYVAHNLIHDTPHVGVLYGSFDSVFEYNEVYRYCTVSEDMGAFYCYDRFGQLGNQTLRYNLIHDTDRGDGIYFDHDHPDMHIYGNVACLRSAPGGRGTGFLYKIGSQAKNPQTIDCHDNIAVQCNYGYVFVSALPGKGRIDDDVAVECKAPLTWKTVQGAKQVVAKDGFATGKIAVYENDPGFADVGHLDFRLKPGARLLKDLPGFQPPPVEKIGLYLDEYRRTLPTDDEIDRFNHRAVHAASGTSIEDRN